MKVAVLGGGVVGVTTAWYLKKAGCAVTLVERQPGAALETSFANAGEISPGYSTPWAAPGVPQKAVKWLMMEHGPLVIRPQADPAQWIWMLRMLQNCTAARYHVNKTRMMRLAEYSRDRLKELRAETGITYDERTLGTLQVFRTQKQLDGITEDLKVLTENGVPFEVLDRDGCAAAEPALARVKSLLVGGLRLPGDETGDCHLFTQRLAEMAEAAGVVFRYGVSIRSIETTGDRVTGVVTSEGRLEADHYVAALGSYSPLMLKTIGVRLPVYPVKGYSLTIPVTNSQLSPVSTVMDETYKVAITRLGDRIRVGGTAELSGYNDRLYPKRRATLEKSVGDLFPEGGDITAASFWSGLRPMTPDGTPIIGPTRYRNLTTNTGHGTLGWTMACGSARVLSDIITGRRTDIPSDDLSVARYG